MRTYEPPTLHQVGSFAGLTGLIELGQGDPLVPLILKALG